MNIKKPALGMKEPIVEQSTSNESARPKNPPVGTIPSKGYVLEIESSNRNSRLQKRR